MCFESCKQVIPRGGIAETMDFQQGKYSVTVDYQSNEWIPVPEVTCPFNSSVLVSAEQLPEEEGTVVQRGGCFPEELLGWS